MIYNDGTNRLLRRDDGHPTTAIEPPRGPSGERRTDQFSVLFVCSANLCRSIAAEVLMLRRLRERLGASATAWNITSAGLETDPGFRVPKACATAMRDHAIPTDTGARQLSVEMIEGADLILTAERGQRSKIVRLVPLSKRRVFTIRQFARFVAAGRETDDRIMTGDAIEMLELASIGRTSVQPVDGRDDDIADPAERRSAAAMTATINVIDAAIADMLG